MTQVATMYKNGHEPRTVWSIDAHDYLGAGWTLEPVAEVAPEPEPEPTPNPVGRPRKTAVMSEPE